MKIILLFLVFLFAGKSFACSELGKVEFKLTEAQLNKCKTVAKTYALAISEAGAKLPNQYAYLPKDAVKAPFRADASQNVYEALNAPKGSTDRTLGLTTTIWSKDGWECLYCVSMRTVEDGSCSLKKIELNHCSK